MHYDTKISLFPKSVQDIVVEENNRNMDEVLKWQREERVMDSFREALMQRFLGVGKIWAGL